MLCVLRGGGVEKGGVGGGSKLPVLLPSVRGKQGEPHRPMIPLTGSADSIPCLVDAYPDLQGSACASSPKRLILF